MLVVLNGLPGCGKTFICNLLQNKYQTLDEDRKIIEELLQSPDYIEQQYGFTELWFKTLKEAVFLWEKDPKATIILVCVHCIFAKISFGMTFGSINLMNNGSILINSLSF